jgi:hypothetical protein
MKWLVMVLVCALMSACTFSNEVGGREVSCVGIGETHDERYVYEVDVGNVIVGALFLPMVVPAAVVVAAAWSCPVRMREAP